MKSGSVPVAARSHFDAGPLVYGPIARNGENLPRTSQGGLRLVNGHAIDFTRKEKQMSFEIPEYTPAERIVCTSVHDAGFAIRRETDINILREAVQIESTGKKRGTLIRSIEARIKKLERMNRVLCGGGRE